MHCSTYVTCIYKSGVIHSQAPSQGDILSCKFLISMLCSGHLNKGGALCSSWIYRHVCMCRTIHRRGWAYAGESPGLSCCCTFPHRDPHFPCTANFLSCFPFWRMPSGHRDVWGLKATELRERKWASRLLLLSVYPPPFLMSFPQRIGGGGWVCTVLEHMWSGWRVKQAVPPWYTYYLCKRLTQHKRMSPRIIKGIKEISWKVNTVLSKLSMMYALHLWEPF